MQDFDSKPRFTSAATLLMAASEFCMKEHNTLQVTKKSLSKRKELQTVFKRDRKRTNTLAKRYM